MCVQVCRYQCMCASALVFACAYGVCVWNLVVVCVCDFTSVIPNYYVYVCELCVSRYDVCDCEVCSRVCL